jgi:hypothetical protein
METPNAHAVDVEAAQAIIAAAAQERQARCIQRIRAALDEERCELKLSIVKVALDNGAWGDVPRLAVEAV